MIFNKINKSICSTLLLSTIAFITPFSQADANEKNWPERTIKLIVPFGAGSTPDMLARLVANKMSENLAQNIIVENKPGAGGNLGTGLIAKAKPDGYTFGVTINGPLVYNQFIYKLNYDPEKDLTPLTLAVTQPNVIAVNNDSGIKSLEDLVKKIKEKPNALNFATPGSGSGSHLSIELLLKSINGQATAIPYASSPQALNSLVTQDTQFTALAPIAVVPLAKEGKLKLLAQTGDKRIDALNDLPTIKETGVADISSSAWNGFVVSSEVPSFIKEKLHKEIVNALKDPEVKEKLEAQYMETIPSSMDKFKTYIQEEKERWEPLIKSLNLQVN